MMCHSAEEALNMFMYRPRAVLGRKSNKSYRFWPRAPVNLVLYKSRHGSFEEEIFVFFESRALKV